MMTKVSMFGSSYIHVEFTIFLPPNRIRTSSVLPELLLGTNISTLCGHGHDAMQLFLFSFQLKNQPEHWWSCSNGAVLSCEYVLSNCTDYFHSFQSTNNGFFFCRFPSFISVEYAQRVTKTYLKTKN